MIARIERLNAELETTGQELRALRQRNDKLQTELAAVTGEVDLAQFDHRNRQLGEDVDACMARATATMDEVRELTARIRTRKARLQKITSIAGAISLALVLYLAIGR